MGALPGATKGRDSRMNNTAVVIIGRNEGERLRRCLPSIAYSGYPVVYVDSGSTDGSPNFARSLGVHVVELDSAKPFTAARGRNSGFEWLMHIDPTVQFVQFVDGDCELSAGWLEKAVKFLKSRQDVATVCGRLRERNRDASIYHRLCDLEWDRPAGDTQSCGGIAMMRVSALRQVGGFREDLSAGEEPELCLRLRRAGWRIWRDAAEMAVHDAGMTRFGQWWKRGVRWGYGALEVMSRFDLGGETAFARQVRSARLWTLVWPFVAICVGLVGSYIVSPVCGVLAASLVVLVLPLQLARVAVRVALRSGDLGGSLVYAAATMIAKWANIVGQYRYLMDQRGRHRRRSVRPTPSLSVLQPGMDVRGVRNGERG